MSGFEWDEGNDTKSYLKHGVTKRQSEEVFLDENLLTTVDYKHSRQEKRYIAIGETFEGKCLFIAFTLRGSKIRIISARKASKKERSCYEKDV